MSFLLQLKQQAMAPESEQVSQQQDVEARLISTETACKTVWSYFNELSRQLNVIEPDAVGLGRDKQGDGSGCSCCVQDNQGQIIRR